VSDLVRGKSPLVTLQQVSKIYESGEVRTDVLRDASLEVYRGEFVVVLGVSGSGKSTLLNLIGGLDTCTSGSIIVDGEDLSHADPEQLSAYRRKKLGFIFQFYNLLPTLTAAENVEAALEIIPLPKAECRERSRKFLERVGLGAKADKYPSQLSGGEQQRVAIARALAKDPVLVLADEPTGNLDEATADKILVDIMKRMNRETQTTFLLVTHNPKIAEHADRVIEIHGGRVLEHSSGRNGSQKLASPSAP
jgi:putative ABC transport system ATP-binding protein